MNEPLTDQWTPYEQGSYIKQPYAIRLKNGIEYEWAWPNAGGFNPDRKDWISETEVTHVKKAKSHFE